MKSRFPQFLAWLFIPAVLFGFICAHSGGDDPKQPSKDDWRQYLKTYRDDWPTYLAKCRKLSALKVTDTELEAYQKVRAIKEAQWALEDEARYDALNGEPEAEVRR